MDEHGSVFSGFRSRERRADDAVNDSRDRLGFRTAEVHSRLFSHSFAKCPEFLPPGRVNRFHQDILACVQKRRRVPFLDSPFCCCSLVPLSRSTQTAVCIFNDKSRFEARDLAGEAGELYGVQDGLTYFRWESEL